MSETVFFEGKENFKISVKLHPDIYKYVRIAAAIHKVGTPNMYKVVRTMEYRRAFNSLRGHMICGLFALYGESFQRLRILEAKEPERDRGDIKNYFVIAVEKNNDLTKEILSYDMYVKQADNFDALIKSDEFKNIPFVDDDKTLVSIMNFGYQYEADSKKIGIHDACIGALTHKVDKDYITLYDFNHTHNEEDEDVYEPLELEDNRVSQTMKEMLSGDDTMNYYVALIPYMTEEDETHGDE